MPNVLEIMNAMRGQPSLWLRCLISIIALITSLSGPKGPGVSFSVEEKSFKHFLLMSALWNEGRVEGLIMIADWTIYLWKSNVVNHPKISRSIVVRLWAFDLDRWMTNSCFFSVTFSAATDFIPLGWSKWTSKAIKWMVSKSTSFM